MTDPLFPSQTKALVEVLKDYSSEDLQKLMKLSENLSVLNVERYAGWGGVDPCPAILSFFGDVYKGLKAQDFTEKDLVFAQDHVAIFSGLYGVIRPLDGIAPYRLEMGTKLENPAGKDLYAFWSEAVTNYLNQLDTDVLINLASNEYSSVIDRKKLEKTMVDIVFKEQKGDTYKIIAIYAKKARGMFARYVVKNRCKNIDQLKRFIGGGYRYEASLSNPEQMVFVR